MPKKRNETFTVLVHIELDTDVEIVAPTLEEALMIGRKLELRDVVEFDGGFNDGSIKVTGIFR